MFAIRNICLDKAFVYSCIIVTCVKIEREPLSSILRH